MGSVSLSDQLAMPEGTPDGVYQGTITVYGQDAETGDPLTAQIAVVITVDATPPAAPVTQPCYGVHRYIAGNCDRHNQFRHDDRNSGRW